MTSEPDPPTTLATIGVDATTLIVSNLDAADALKLAIVSHAFAAAAQTRLSLLDTLDLSGSDCDDEHLEEWLQRAPVLTSLLCDRAPNICALPLALEYPAASTLQRLSLSGTALDAAGLLVIWQCLPRLEALDVSECKALDDDATNFIQEPPASNVFGELSMARCPNLSALAAEAIASLCCESLVSLDLSGYDDALPLFGGYPARARARSCNGVLRTLKLNECANLDDGTVMEIVCHMSGLTSLDFSWCECLSEAAAETIGLHCSALEELELRSCSCLCAITVLKAVGNGCPKLRVLNINRCALVIHDVKIGAASEALMETLRDPPRRLMRLCESFEKSNSAIGVAAIGPLLRCRDLEWLDVGWLTELIDNDAVNLLLLSLPKLRVLSVEGCKRLTNDALKPLLGEHMPRVEVDPTCEAEIALTAPLERLNCSWVDDIRNECLHKAVLSAKSVRNRSLLALDYYGTCWGVVEEAMADLGWKVTKCELSEIDALRLPLKGWVAAFDNGESLSDLASNRFVMRREQ